MIKVKLKRKPLKELDATTPASSTIQTIDPTSEKTIDSVLLGQKFNKFANQTNSAETVKSLGQDIKSMSVSTKPDALSVFLTTVGATKQDATAAANKMK